MIYSFSFSNGEKKKTARGKTIFETLDPKSLQVYLKNFINAILLVYEIFTAEGLHNEVKGLLVEWLWRAACCGADQNNLGVNGLALLQCEKDDIRLKAV